MIWNVLWFLCLNINVGWNFFYSCMFVFQSGVLTVSVGGMWHCFIFSIAGQTHFCCLQMQPFPRPLWRFEEILPSIFYPWLHFCHKSFCPSFFPFGSIRVVSQSHFISRKYWIMRLSRFRNNRYEWINNQ